MGGLHAFELESSPNSNNFTKTSMLPFADKKNVKGHESDETSFEIVFLFAVNYPFLCAVLVAF
jgi:hypothetical protein